MARLTRKTSKLFAENATATNIGQFGSLNAGTKVETNDIDTIQALPAWGDGWEAAGLGQNCYPTLQERNGLDYVQSYMTNYLYQEGVPEWDNNTTYYIGSLVKLINGTNVQLYQSIVDNNTAALSDSTAWTAWNYANLDLSNLSPAGEARFSNAIPTGIVTYFAKGTVPNGFLICNGSTISRTTYASLFSVIGTTFGSGDGSTTFKLPDLIGKYIKGSTTVGTSLNSKLPNITGTFTLHNDNNQVYLISGPSSATGAFSLVSEGTYKTAYPSGGKYSAYSMSFKASNSNTIYDSNITTVQPPSLTMLPCIKY